MAMPWCCAPNCIIYSATFDGADSSTIGTGWIEDAGNWTKTGNKLQITTSNARARYEIPFAGNYTFEGPRYITVEAKVRATQSGDRIRLFAFYSSADVHVIGELEVNSSASSAKARIIQRFGGVNTTIGECDVTAFPDTDYKFKICAEAEGIPGTTNYSRVKLFLGGDGVLVADVFSASGARYHGCATEAITGTVTFDDFKISDNGLESACQCVESCALVAEWPDQVEVEVSGLSNTGGIGGPACANCADVDGIYTLDKVSASPQGVVTYELSVSEACSITLARLIVGYTSPTGGDGPGCYILFDMSTSSSGIAFTVVKKISSACSDDDGPFVLDVASSAGTCNPATATITVTLL